MRKLKYVKLFENFQVNESLLYKPDGGPEEYLFVYGNKTSKNKMIAHTAWKYTRKPVSDTLRDSIKGMKTPDNWSLKSTIQDADEVEYLQDSHNILPMFRFKLKGKPLAISGNDGRTIIDGWISNKLLGLWLHDYDFQDMERKFCKGFINEDELDKFIEHNEISDANGFKKALKTAGYTILGKGSVADTLTFIHDPNSLYKED
jgi:hypothetical protein